MIQIEKGKIPASLIGKSIADKVEKEEFRVELQRIFNYKCCYCETAFVKGEIEHFRPQSKYSWLKNDWENLLLSCTDCNRHKSNKFDICGTPATEGDSFKICESKEKPCMVNPVTENPEPMLTFDNEGKIFHNDPELCCNDKTRMQYTIETCDLDRVTLNFARFYVFQEVSVAIATAVRLSENEDDLKNWLNKFVIERIKTLEASFIAYRKFIVKNWLSDILKQII